MARRKKKKPKASRKTKSLLFRRGSSKKTRKRRQHPTLISILKMLAIIIVVGGVVVGFLFLKQHVHNVIDVEQTTARLELVGPPPWLTEALEEKIYTAARAYGEDLKIDEDVAESVQKNIKAMVAWLDEVTVVTTHDKLLINARWRKPLALVKLGTRRFYIDVDLVVLDFVEMPNLPIVKIEGLSISGKIAPPGEVWHLDDLEAAIAVLDRLDRRDKIDPSKKPLLYEIDRIDVSNFNGRKNSRSHITLYAKDNTEIIWGAEIGTWQRHLEATDAQKLAKLYGYYEKYGSLQNGVKYINLRDPQQTIPLPVDKY